MSQSKNKCIAKPDVGSVGDRAQIIEAPAVNFRGHLPALDGLRGLAILMVLFHHIWPYVWDNTLFKLLSTVKHVGWIGVDLFFVLSGFLITGILIDTREKPGYFRNFIARRSLRVFPLYYVFLLISFTIIPAFFTSWGVPESSLIGVLPWFLFYISNYLPFFADPTIMDSIRISAEVPDSIVASLSFGSQIPDYLSVTWSLCVEEQFYLLWPVVILCVARMRLAVIGTFVLCIVACRTWAVMELENWQQVSYMCTFCRADSLLIGAAVASYVRCDSFSPRCWLYFIRFAAVVILPTAVLWIVVTGGRANPLFASLGYTTVAIGFSGWLGMSLTTGHSPINRGLMSPILRWFGKYSYGLYLYHMLVLAAFAIWRPAEMTPSGLSQHPETFSPIGGNMLVDAPVRTLLVLGISMGTAWTSYHFLERPFLKLKRYFDTKTSQEIAEPSLPAASIGGSTSRASGVITT